MQTSLMEIYIDVIFLENNLAVQSQKFLNAPWFLDLKVLLLKFYTGNNLSSPQKQMSWDIIQQSSWFWKAETL